MLDGHAKRIKNIQQQVTVTTKNSFQAILNAVLD